MSRLLLFLLLVSAISAHAGQWREVGEVGETGTIVSVDDASLSVDHDSVVTGWVRFEYPKPKERDGYKLTGYTSQRMVNCEINRYWVMDSWGYPSNNTEPVRLYSADQEWQMPPPDSEAEIAAAALCNETMSFLGIGFDIFSRLQTVWSILKGAISH